MSKKRWVPVTPKDAARRWMRMQIAGIVVAVLAGGAALWYGYRTLTTASISLAASERIDQTPQTIESIRQTGQWELLTISDEQMVDTVRKGLLSDDHLVRIYYGTLRLGIDLTNAPADMLHVTGDSVTATLPAVGLLDEDFIDEARTRSFHESGRWKPADREAMYRKAKRQMLRRSMTPSNLQAARENGEQQFRRILESLGFQHITISWKQI